MYKNDFIKIKLYDYVIWTRGFNCAEIGELIDYIMQFIVIEDEETQAKFELMITDNVNDVKRRFMFHRLDFYKLREKLKKQRNK